MDKYQKLIDELVEQKYLVSPHIIKAFRNTPRVPFVRDIHKMLHSLNCPLPIGEGQTISQPLTVAFMVQMLAPQTGDRILEIGYGSGWQTAILAKIVCSKNVKTCGEIHAYEIVKSIADFGRKNLDETLSKTVRSHVHLYAQDYSGNSARNAPYDRIIAAAAFDKRPDDLIKSLSIEGIFVFPSKQGDIRKITRQSRDRYSEEIFPGFVFVPITHDT
ncbi:MAG: protein-L-isoaspartate O-methyltransferase [Candidatus Dojkabacteria bacterium]|nr:protein-L-isoaspartate O-methyltransferase [Candidatus Dojkabacteria bacterium]